MTINIVCTKDTADCCDAISACYIISYAIINSNSKLDSTGTLRDNIINNLIQIIYKEKLQNNFRYKVLLKVLSYCRF